MPDSENLKSREQQIRERIAPLINAARHSLQYFNEPDRWGLPRGRSFAFIQSMTP
jgi:hypothetical protein